jgi:hypothetical protein
MELRTELGLIRSSGSDPVANSPCYGARLGNSMAARSDSSGGWDGEEGREGGA